MIISHKHKFIFIKAIKVAGTSVEIALAKHCGDNDIITNNSKYNPESDDFDYKQFSQNYEDEGYHQHITPKEIKEKIKSDEVWNEYFKFTIVRNPWDKTISDYFWNLPKKKLTKKNISPHLFNPNAYKYIVRNIGVYLKKITGTNTNKCEAYILSRKKSWTNTKFYFDENGKPYCDFYMRYENLEEDYKRVCEKIGIPYEELPKTKNNFRKGRKHYSQYFNKKTKNKIHSLCKEEINYFKYKFEIK